MKIKFSKNQRQFIINVFIICSILSITIIYFLNLILPNKTTENIATTVAGILGTAFSFFGSILVYKALQSQIKANKLITQQFNLQQFESRLYKMLDIYNLNVSNLTFIGRKSGNVFEGKKVFPHLINNFNKLKKDILNFNEQCNINLTRIIEENYKQHLIKLKKNEEIDDWAILELSYIIFFYGVGITGRKNIKSILNGKYNSDYIKKMLNYLSHKPVEYNTSDLVKDNWINLMISFEDFDNPNNQNFDKFYNGHQNNLGHYFRHIFMIIKFINEQKNITYLEKWEYSKLLRTQLSNHEQELFFLNSISIVGREWELNHIVSDDLEIENKKFITKYDLIKNIPKSSRDKYKIEELYPNLEFENELGLTDYRKKLEEKFYN